MDYNYAQKVGCDDSFFDPDINIPVPYKAGDIITIDGYPFSKPKTVLVLKVGDNEDCCCLQALYMQDGCYGVGAVKHGMVGLSENYPRISPLYGVTISYDESASELQLIKRTQKYIEQDEARGNKLWEILWLKAISGDELKSVLSRLEAEEN